MLPTGHLGLPESNPFGRETKREAASRARSAVRVASMSGGRQQSSRQKNTQVSSVTYCLSVSRKPPIVPKFVRLLSWDRLAETASVVQRGPRSNCICGVPFSRSRSLMCHHFFETPKLCDSRDATRPMRHATRASTSTGRAKSLRTLVAELRRRTELDTISATPCRQRPLDPAGSYGR